MVRQEATEIRELTYEEGWELLDREARRCLDMDAEEFVRAWEAGEFGEPDDRPEVLEVAMLLPFIGRDPWCDGQNTQGSNR